MLGVTAQKRILSLFPLPSLRFHPRYPSPSHPHYPSPRHRQAEARRNRRVEEHSAQEQGASRRSLRSYGQHLEAETLAVRQPTLLTPKETVVATRRTSPT